jgi:hypothetical protein
MPSDDDQPAIDLGDGREFTKDDLMMAIDSAIGQLVTLRKLVHLAVADPDNTTPVKQVDVDDHFGGDDDDVDPATCRHKHTDQTFEGLWCIDCGTRIDADGPGVSAPDEDQTRP